MLGRVTNCKRGKEYCFIKDMRDENVYFCHFSCAGDEILENGYLVNFRVAYDWKNDRVQAKDVKVIDAWYRSKK